MHHLSLITVQTSECTYTNPRGTALLLQLQGLDFPRLAAQGCLHQHHHTQLFCASFSLSVTSGVVGPDLVVLDCRNNHQVNLKMRFITKPGNYNMASPRVERRRGWGSALIGLESGGPGFRGLILYW